MADQNIIKTTARYQEAQEPSKQRPIIHVGLAGSQPLPNTIRASLETGRDNPFKPDGPIYRSADPIVDFYKQAANQSRPTSPTDSQLLLQADSGTAQTRQDAQSKSEGQARERACWRRWLCCCCSSAGWCKSNKSGHTSPELAPTKTTRRDEQQVPATSAKGVVLAQPNTAQRDKSKCSAS